MFFIYALLKVPLNSIELTYLITTNSTVTDQNDGRVENHSYFLINSLILSLK